MSKVKIKSPFATAKHNPFEVKEDLEVQGSRGKNSVLMYQLAEQVANLDPSNKKASVLIPPSTCSSINQTNGLFAATKKILLDNKETKSMAFTCRHFKDGDTYLGARIWRIA